MTVKTIICLLLVLMVMLPVTAAAEEKKWVAGFGSEEIRLPVQGKKYIAGYNNGWEIEGILDLQRANAVYLSDGSMKVLMIGVDCVGLSSGTVKHIKKEVADVIGDEEIEVHIYATHDHAGFDTLGLWGPTGVTGKNEEFMENLTKACCQAAWAALRDRSEGKLYYSSADTGSVQRDSRKPLVYDRNLYQLHFVPDGDNNGIRMIFYAAHAESLRGDNRMLSRDYPGVMSDRIKEATGEDTLFLPGAIGGLIMTDILSVEQYRQFRSVLYDSGYESGSMERNCLLTGCVLAEIALNAENERELKPDMAHTTVEFDVPLDNPLFMVYRYLGILEHVIGEGEGETGYSAHTSLSLLRVDDVLVAMLPCELFPELALGEYLKYNDPKALNDIAKEAGYDTVLIVGLCDDELGYVVPPSQFLLNPDKPFLERQKDETGEDHYEETNSMGERTAECIAAAFESACHKMNK